MRRVQAAFLIVLIIIGYGSSAALAAEGALPGDVLYPVKTKVVEPLARLVVARTPEREAAFETKLLERRLREAEALDAAATLDTPLREEVRERVRAQSARAETTARKADDESDDEGSDGDFKKLQPSSDTRLATSTVATTSPAQMREDRRPERSSDTRDRSGRDENRAERAARVLKEHKRILEKLELSNEGGDNAEHGADGRREDD